MTKNVGKNDYWLAFKASIDATKCEMRTYISYSNDAIKCTVTLNEIVISETFGYPENIVNPYNILPEGFKNACNYLQNIGERRSKGLNVNPNERQLPTEFFGTDRENDTPPKSKNVQKQPILRGENKNTLRKQDITTETNRDEANIKIEVKGNDANPSETAVLNLDADTTVGKKKRKRNKKVWKSKVNSVSEQLENLQIIEMNSLDATNIKDKDDVLDRKSSEVIDGSTNIPQKEGSPEIGCDKIKENKNREYLSQFVAPNDEPSTSTAAAKELEETNDIAQSLATALNLFSERLEKSEILKNPIKENLTDKDEPSSKDSESDSNDEYQDKTDSDSDDDDIDEINDVSLELSSTDARKMPLKHKNSIMVRRIDLLRNTITKNQDKSIKSSISTHHNFEHKKIQSNNVGFQMMQSIGWTGGALGANSDGIVEPIGITIPRGRAGFGATTIVNAPQQDDITAAKIPNNAKKSNKQKKDKRKTYGSRVIRSFLENYAKDPKQTDALIVSSEFMKKEQKKLKRVAKRFGLIYNSGGEDAKNPAGVSLIITKPAEYSFEKNDEEKQRENKTKNKRPRKRMNQHRWALKGEQMND